LAKPKKGVMPAALKAYWAKARKTGKVPKGTPKKLAAFHMKKGKGK
jgi:hypothetical protein